MRNPYEVLGVSKDASDNDIKKAYRKLAIKYHPDRQTGKSDEEKKQAEEKMAEINQAYEILSDKNKRAQFDQFGTVDPNMQGGFGGFDEAQDMFNHMREAMGGFDDGFFGGFGGFGRHHRRQNTVQPGRTLQIDVDITLSDLMKRDTVEVKYMRRVRCKHCHGAGGTDIHDCPHCHGTGVIQDMQRTPFGVQIQTRPCEYCGGTGKTVGVKCEECNGTGFENKETVIKVKIPANITNNMGVRLQNEGDEAKDERGQNGDLIIIFKVNIDTKRFAIQGNDIFEAIKVPYYDAILGCEKKITLPDDSNVTIKIPEYSTMGQQVTLKGQGIHGGDYKFVIQLDMPTYINKKEKSYLEKIKKENEK